jgi:hypothetical protein
MKSKEEERIRTLNLDGKKGVNIPVRKYNQMKEFVLATLKKEKELTWQELVDIADKELEGKFDGNIGWHLISVKLDLEARGIVERIPNVSPQRLKLSK